jgi:hypothetical protein
MFSKYKITFFLSLLFIPFFVSADLIASPVYVSVQGDGWFNVSFNGTSVLLNQTLPFNYTFYHNYTTINIIVQNVTVNTTSVDYEQVKTVFKTASNNVLSDSFGEFADNFTKNLSGFFDGKLNAASTDTVNRMEKIMNTRCDFEIVKNQIIQKINDDVAPNKRFADDCFRDRVDMNNTLIKNEFEKNYTALHVKDIEQDRDYLIYGIIALLLLIGAIIYDAYAKNRLSLIGSLLRRPTATPATNLNMNQMPKADSSLGVVASSIQELENK